MKHVRPMSVTSIPSKAECDSGKYLYSTEDVNKLKASV